MIDTPWPFPFLTALRNMRGQRFGAAPAAEEAVIPEGAGAEIPAAEVPAVTEIVEEPADTAATFAPVGGPIYKGSEYSAEGVKFDVYYQGSIQTFPYGVKCPSSPFYDKMHSFRTYEDAKWYVQEVVHGSRSEKVAAEKAASEAAQAAAVAKFERAGYI